MFFDKTSWNRPMERMRSNHRQIQNRDDSAAYYSCTTKSPVLSFQLHRLLRVLKLYYKVASSQLPAPQIAPRAKVVLPSRQFSSSSSPDTPRTKVALPSRQFSSSSSPDTPRAKVALQSRQFSSSSSSSSPGALRTKVVLQRTKVVPQSRQFSASSSTDCSAHQSCTSESPVLSFQLHRLPRVLKLYKQIASSHLPAPQIALSPAFRALDTHDLRRGLHFRLTLFYLYWDCTGILTLALHWHTLALSCNTFSNRRCSGHTLLRIARSCLGGRAANKNIKKTINSRCVKSKLLRSVGFP